MMAAAPRRAAARRSRRPRFDHGVRDPVARADRGAARVCGAGRAGARARSAALGVLGQVVLRADDVDHAAALVERFMRLTDTALRCAARARRLHRSRVQPPAPGRSDAVSARGDARHRLSRACRHAAGERARRCARSRSRTRPAIRSRRTRSCSACRCASARPRRAVASARGARDARSPPRSDCRADTSRRTPSSCSRTLPAPRRPIVAQIREAVLSRARDERRRLARVARRVAMSTRTRAAPARRGGHDLPGSRRRRARRAGAALLRDRARSIIDVAFELGYADLKGFYRAFRRWTDTTPAEWRGC